MFLKGAEKRGREDAAGRKGAMTQSRSCEGERLRRLAMVMHPRHNGRNDDGDVVKTKVTDNNDRNSINCHHFSANIRNRNSVNGNDNNDDNGNSGNNMLTVILVTLVIIMNIKMI